MTLRRCMALILGLAVALGLAIPAVEVWKTRDYHSHTSVMIQRGLPVLVAEGAIEPPFWPRYWRRIAGRPWRGQALCSPRAGHLLDRCVRAYPSMLEPIGGGRMRVIFSRDQEAMVRRLRGPSRRS